MQVWTLLIAGMLQGLSGNAADRCRDAGRVVDTFAVCSDYEAKLPCGWKPSRKDISMFSLHTTGGERFISVASTDDCTSAAAKISLNLSEFPFLCWQWRVWQVPVKAREDDKRFNDSGAGVYVIFKGKLGSNRIIKYVWSSTLAEGTALTSPYRKNSKVVVLESGMEKKGQWITEKVDVRADYTRLFDGKVPPVQALGILTDSDDTHSSAQADYGVFFAVKE